MPPIKPTKFRQLLRFSRGNAKLPRSTAIISLPAGYTCPGALNCLTRADRVDGHLTDGKKIAHRCYAATQEAAFPNLRRWRWENFEMLKQAATSERMAELIMKSLAQVRGSHYVRIHGSGDFYNQAYFDAWMMVAGQLPRLQFYAYTKSLGFWTKRIINPEPGIPRNVALTASMGGKYDDLVERFDLPKATVVDHPDVAAALQIPIDHDDSNARIGTKHFALLLHGQQPAGSAASAALKRMRTEGIIYSY